MGKIMSIVIVRTSDTDIPANSLITYLGLSDGKKLVKEDSDNMLKEIGEIMDKYEKKLS